MNVDFEKVLKEKTVGRNLQHYFFQREGVWGLVGQAETGCREVRGTVQGIGKHEKCCEIDHFREVTKMVVSGGRA